MLLGATVNSLAFADQSTLALNDMKLPTPTFSADTNGSVTPKSDWSYVRSNGLPAKGVNGTRTTNYMQTQPDARDLVSLTAVPAAKEFWLRMGALSIESTWTASTDSIGTKTIAEFIGADGKVISAIKLGVSSNVVTITYNVYDATGTVVVTSTVATTPQTAYPKDSYGNYAIDIRVLLDSVAGYVQVYNTSAALLGEVLGRTLFDTTMPVTVGLACPFPFVEPDMRAQVAYTILSTTQTFGMYALPLLTKAAGIHSDMLSGDYNNFTEHKTTALPATPIKLEASTGQSKAVDFKYNSLADIGLPANFTLDAVVLKGLFTAVNTDGSVVPTKLTLSTDGVTFTNVATANVVPNLELASGLYQTKSVLLTTNPVTSTAWSVSDLNNFYAGFKLEV